MGKRMGEGLLRARALVVAIAVLIAGSACSRPPLDADPGTAEVVSSETGTVEDDVGHAPEAPAPEAGPVSRPPVAAGEGHDEPAPAPAVAPDDHGPVGANAFAYLSAGVPRLVVEIVAVEGFAPHPGTVELLRQRLQQVADKPGGIDILPVRTVPLTTASWTVPQLMSAESAYRTGASTPEAASLYLFYANGDPSSGGSIGLAYSASSAVLFGERIRSAATVLVSASSIERASTIHEVGHLLSLVNLGYTSPREREDSRHPGHSTNPDSVMYSAVDNVGVANLLGGRTEPPTQFDAADLADLEDVRAGRLRPG